MIPDSNVRPFLSVDGAAVDLAQAIKETAEWSELQDARASFQADPDMMALMSRYRRVYRMWREATTGGRGMIGADAQELAEVNDAIQRHPAFVRQHEATEALVSVLHRINDTISAEIGLDFAANAAPRGGGCCG